MQAPIEIVDYDPLWPQRFTDERAELLCVQWMTISPICERLLRPLWRTAAYCREHSAASGWGGTGGDVGVDTGAITSYR